VAPTDPYAAGPEFYHVGDLLSPTIPIVGCYAPAFADINNDGLIDAVCGSEMSAELSLWINTGTYTEASFENCPATPCGHVFATVNALLSDNFVAPALADVDCGICPIPLIPAIADQHALVDDDLDIVIGDASGLLKYLENTGSATSPEFQTVTTSGPLEWQSCPANLGSNGNECTMAKPAFRFNVLLSVPAFCRHFVDSLVVGSNVGYLRYFEVKMILDGNATTPTFTERRDTDNPFDNLLTMGTQSAPAIADLVRACALLGALGCLAFSDCCSQDGDGDEDIVVAYYDATILYLVQQTGIINSAMHNVAWHKTH